MDSLIVSRELFDAVVQRLPEALCETPNFLELAVEFRLPVDTLVNIHGLVCQRYVKMNHHIHKALVPQYCSRYLQGEDVCSISEAVNFSPCLIMRLLLEHLELGLSKEGLKDVMNSPNHLPCHLKVELPREEVERLQANIEDARMMDRIYSPIMDSVRRITGLEYEALLYESLRMASVPFWSEDDLRRKGYVKTPDAKLQVPIAVEGHIVNWIDSKATFGDERNHRNQYNEQYQQYVTRYGQGMVIYWFGFVRELQDDENVLLVQEFPENIQQLPRLKF